MALYHLQVKIISRSAGRSSVAAAAYRAGEKFSNEIDGRVHDYSKRADVVAKKIFLPENAPKSFNSRSTLWNAVEQAEKRINSQTAREIEIALPTEFSREFRNRVLSFFVEKNFVNQGMCADVVVHDKGDGNPHAHILLTTREVTREGFTVKNREWNRKELLESWREAWAKTCNTGLKQIGLQERVDHRSHAHRGLKKIPTKHEGFVVRKIEKSGRRTHVGNQNRAIQNINAVAAIELEQRQRKEFLERNRNTNTTQDPGRESLIGKLGAIRQKEAEEKAVERRRQEQNKKRNRDDFER